MNCWPKSGPMAWGFIDMGFYLHECDKDALPAGSGIYRIRHRPNRRFKPVGRAARVDRKGIIYIGESSDLRDRIWTFRKVVFNDYVVTEGHVAANRYVRIRPLHRAFPPSSLWFEIEEIGDSEEAERAAQLDYINTFGELPPLNYGGPYRSDDEEMGIPVQFPLPG